MKLSTVPGMSVGNKKPVYAPRVEGTLNIISREVRGLTNPLDKTPPQKSARDGQRPEEISPGLWDLLKKGKLVASLGHPAEGGFKSPKGGGGTHFGSKKR